MLNAVHPEAPAWYEDEPMWSVNCGRPTHWCLWFHRRHWCSNDFGTWWTSGRRTYEVRCLKCGDCWTHEKGRA